MDTLEILAKAREYIARGWCRFALARDTNGVPLWDPNSPDAVTWCATGAVMAAMGTPAFGDTERIHFFGTITNSILGDGDDSYHRLVWWNNADDQTQEGVLAGFDAAIQQEEARRGA